MNWTERPIKRSALKGRAMDDDICRNRQMQLWLLGVQTYMQAGRQAAMYSDKSRPVCAVNGPHTAVACGIHRAPILAFDVGADLCNRNYLVLGREPSFSYF